MTLTKMLKVCLEGRGLNVLGAHEPAIEGDTDGEVTLEAGYHIQVGDGYYMLWKDDEIVAESSLPKHIVTAAVKALK